MCFLSACKYEHADLLKKAEAGDPIAQFRLAEDLIKEQKCEEGLKWYKEAIKNPNKDILCGFGLLHVRGTCMDKNLYKGIEYLTAASDKNSADAQNNLGVLFVLGNGTKKDLEKAFKLFNLSASQGWSEAEFNLGICYTLGLGTEKNEEKANEFFEKSVFRGVNKKESLTVRRYVESFKESSNSEQFLVDNWYMKE
ncbi:MAG: hypothetical protein HEEMFOPI_01929 [Holosporales bacterium]